MASVSVVHFNTSPHKVLQQQNNTSNSNTNSGNSTDRREIIVLRKTPQILPQPKDYTKNGDILITNTGRKKSRSGKDIRTQPQPIAVARRNARERNRVKQVNNGFANLRQHIPNFIAATFESNARGSNKKLSKVETLRMAVEYIRSLEDLLAMDRDNNNENSSTYSSPPPPPSTSASSLPSSTTTTVTSNSLQYHQILSPPTDDDDLSSNPTSSPQYIRIDSTTYQIIPSHLYDDSENLEPLNILSEADLEFSNSQDLLQSIHSDSLSPGIYSEQSLSPGIIEKDTSTQRYQQIYHDDGSLVQIKTEIGAEIPVMSLKTEQELPQQCKNNVINVMQWWEQQQQQQEHEHADNIS